MLCVTGRVAGCEMESGGGGGGKIRRNYGAVCMPASLVVNGVCADSGHGVGL